MTATLLAFVLALSPAAKSKIPDPADYSTTVHVQSSHIETRCVAAVCYNFLHLEVLISGKKYELSGYEKKPFILRTGDYKARRTKEDQTTTYQYEQTYEFLLTDGSTLSFDVVGESE